MGSLEEIYWNMAKKQWKVGAHYAVSYTHLTLPTN